MRCCGCTMAQDIKPPEFFDECLYRRLAVFWVPTSQFEKGAYLDFKFLRWNVLLGP